MGAPDQSDATSNGPTNRCCLVDWSRWHNRKNRKLKAISPMFVRPPEVKLTRTFRQPFANVVETARTCYSPKGIVEEQEMGPRWEALAQDLYRAGHHTTFQHATFQFAITGVSRQLIWSFLHAHPFYNSEQVSQRYVTVRPDNCLIPALDEPARSVFVACVERQMADYQTLTEALLPVTEEAYFDLFRSRAKARDKYATAIRKRAQEVARYCLPVATTAYLYHTISGLTLLRYQRASLQPDAPSEQRLLVAAMVAAVLAVDPGYRAVLEEARPWRAPAVSGSEIDRDRARAFCTEFDARLGARTSRLVACPSENVTATAGAVREVLGLCAGELDDESAIGLVLDPAQNDLLGENLNLTTHDKLSRCLAHAHFTFAKRLSHTADSQDQRHRMTPGSRPILARHYTGEPDYAVPGLIQGDPGVEQAYRDSMARSWEAMEYLLDLGVSTEFALYLLPNAANVRFTESADLLNLHHKHRMRLCYNAQEEIWRASLDEAEQIRAAQPELGRHLLPPCTQRLQAKVRPICPEGERYCGVPVWKLDLGEYRRVL
jgi:flavin-dependent thymidylate synthase